MKRVSSILLTAALFSTVALRPAIAAEIITLPDLTVELAETNRCQGLSVPSGGDGTNIPVTIAGQPARRMTGERTHYLYVCIDHPAYASGPRDLYVIAEVYDDTFTWLRLQYDKAATPGDVADKYARCADSVLMTGAGGLRRGIFHLPAARLGRGQNHGADFRFWAQGLAVRRITVTTHKPADYEADKPVDAASLRALRVEKPAGMELTFGNDATPADAAVFKALGVTSVESYVDWAGVEPEEGKWDWSKWDKQVATLKAAGLKWVPFLIAGPAYATPLWFQRGPHSHVYRCLEHDRDSKVQSLFNPDLPRYVERFVKAFAERYGKAGVIESVLLGVTGIYGESIYPAGPEGGWTARLTGDYHNHHGWWTGDEFAIAAFRTAMKKKYSGIAALNKAWSTNHASFASVKTFLPDKAPSDRARADLAEWYQQAMTDWSALWVRATRRAMPKAEIYLCTGGDGSPFLGADFTAQTKAIAPFGAGVRITNEGSDYAANFTITREVATATRHYRTFSGFEPASGVNATGVVARIYNATASGARQLHYYTNNVLDNAASLKNFRANVAQLLPRRPRVDAALYVPRETWALAQDAVHRWYGVAHDLRDLVDVDFVTRLTVADGVLRGHHVLVLAETPVLEPKAAAAIEQWVRRGGVLIVTTRPGEVLGGRLHSNEAWRARLLADAKDCAGLLKPALDGDAPAHWVLNVGDDGDDAWLFGDWHGREKLSSKATMRWSGARPGVYLPVKPGGDYTLLLTAGIPGYGIMTVGKEVRVNGRVIGMIEKVGAQSCEFRVPAAALGNEPVARLEIAVEPWKPSEHGAKDSRTLGISVRRIELMRAGAEQSAPAAASLRLALDPQRLAPLTRRVGKGWTVLLPGMAGDAKLLNSALSQLLRETPAYLAGVAPLAPADGRMDGRFATATADGVLWFEPAGACIRQSPR
ncbi:MAG: beta-galactosidase [Verrucomicrobia bacterium]|nr:beta-galactosidase [Verrucomicrobiota bacterium]